MNNTSNLQNSNSQCKLVYPHIVFSFARKGYKIAELLTVFTADLLDLVHLHIVIPPESPFAAIRVSIPTSFTYLNLLIIVVPNSTNYRIFYCDNCQKLLSQLPPLVNIIKLTQLLQRCPNHLVAHTVKRLKHPPPKSHHLISLIKNHKHKKPKNTPTQSLLLLILQIDIVLPGTPPTLPHNQ